MAFTEFYCQSGGSNLNGGSDTGNSAKYTSTNGNWNGTSTFTPADTQAASLIAVGDFASVYLDGATVGVYIARVTTINQSGGNITSVVLSTTAAAGSAPSSGATGRTIKVGGAFKGPNGASGFPLSLNALGSAQNASGNRVRVNMKNDATYTISSGISVSVANTIIQGYSSTTGDFGRAIIDTSTNNIGIISGTMSNSVWMDIVFASSSTSGTTALFTASLCDIQRCVFHGGRASALVASSNIVSVFESEFYNNNTSNTSAKAAIEFGATSGTLYVRNCYIHDNAGSNNSGILINSSNIRLMVINTIFDTNGFGILCNSSGSSVFLDVTNSDFYNHSADAIKMDSTAVKTLNVTNCNFVKNTGARVNISAGAALTTGYMFNNGSGTGTQANGADTLGQIIEPAASGPVLYASGVTPWVNPASEDFNINLSAANFAGRGVFTETDGTSSVTVGYPDIGAAQSKTGPGGTFSKEVSYNSAS